ncbi:MAG: hypothetical protein ABI741_09750 [Ferruginibacter sp.]
MKKQILLLAAGICFSITSLMAQDNVQRQTPEDRTKAAMEKMAPLNLDADTKAKTEVIMADFYTSQQNAMREMRASGTMDREAMSAKRKELADARDAKLKMIFTQEQLKKWIDEIEPGLRPQRQPKN